MKSERKTAKGTKVHGAQVSQPRSLIHPKAKEAVLVCPGRQAVPPTEKAPKPPALSLTQASNPAVCLGDPVVTLVGQVSSRKDFLFVT